jgi:hypothetical protein
MKSDPKQWLAAVVLVAVVSGCVEAGANSNLPSLSSASPSPSRSGLTLSIANNTTIAVTLVVNQRVIGVFAAGGHADPIEADLPGLP